MNGVLCVVCHMDISSGPRAGGDRRCGGGRGIIWVRARGLSAAGGGGVDEIQRNQPEKRQRRQDNEERKEPRGALIGNPQGESPTVQGGREPSGWGGDATDKRRKAAGKGQAREMRYDTATGEIAGKRSRVK